MVNKISTGILNALLPHYCALCGLQSHRSFALCMGCEQDLTPNTHACYRCGIPLPSMEPPSLAPWRSKNLTCGTCLAQPPPFDRVVAPWLYEECMAHLIQRWKFQKEQALTPLLYALWQRRVAESITADVLVPVPLHWARRWQRGFNQAERFAQSIHAGLNNTRRVALHRSLLRRSRATIAQSGINAAQRQRNLVNAFTVRKRCDNLRIALIDDVVTTGATAAAAALALRRAGAAEVHVYCLARTPSPSA